uniref:GRIP domain-containing protein n=1 Tax=Macrostomum lignano TaxID=282301 RepID=A0A1I8F5X5_9PLAT
RVLTVQRELLNRLLEAGAGGGGRRSDSWPTKIWLRPWPSSMATSWRWPGPTLLMEELPAAGGKLPSASRAFALHLLGCGSPADRRHVLTRLLACQDPFGAAGRLSTPGQDQPIVDDESIDSTVSESDLSSGVRISALTCPPLYSWLYSVRLSQPVTSLALSRPAGGTSRTPDACRRC